MGTKKRLPRKGETWLGFDKGDDPGQCKRRFKQRFSRLPKYAVVYKQMLWIGPLTPGEDERAF